MTSSVAHKFRVWLVQPFKFQDFTKAIILMIVAITLFSALDTSAKYLGEVYSMPVPQVAWARFFGQFILVLLLVPSFGSLSILDLFRTKNLKLQLARSILMAATTVFNFLALRDLRLDQTVTIIFLTPLCVALVGGPILGEWIDWRRMCAIIIGFSGVVISLNPSLDMIQPAVIYSFSAMLAYALFILLTRYMATLDSPMVTLFYSMFVGTFLGAPMALSSWKAPPDILAFILLLMLGIFGGLGHWLFLHAYRLAPASAVAPFLYFQLISMVGFGFLVFGDTPNLLTLLGSSIVIASGIYLFRNDPLRASAK
ncbi:MAG: DMT family transporter [Hyphomicrobium sp.]